MSKINYGEELENLRKYIQSPSSEKAKQLFLYPIFQKIFKDSFKIENDVKEADGYVEGQLIVESKSNFNQWVKGFFQALHYEQKYGLAFHTIIVIAKDFVGIWKTNKLPLEIKEISLSTDRDLAPSKAGIINAKKVNASDKIRIIESSQLFVRPEDFVPNIYRDKRSYLFLVDEIKDILLEISLGTEFKRTQINLGNFISIIEQMKRFFEKPIDAVHSFYTMVAFWDITSILITNEKNEINLLGFQHTKFSKKIEIHEKNFNEFKKFVETKYIKINGGSGIRTDDYFARFDEAIAAIDPEYVRQHGIFFTDNNLSKFALWFANEYLEENIKDDYIVFDPAGGSGNLVSSWRGHLKHKIVSELQADLLKTIEKRLEADPYHINTGFTIIPKTSLGEGLNFLDTSAEAYLQKLYTELTLNNQVIDKPFAFLLNPPYKNTKENSQLRKDANSNYKLHPSIIEIAGDEAIIERYLAFLAQIISISVIQNQRGLKSIVMIFTPTSWLVPRPAFVSFRETWDKHFKFNNGFIITSNEFFKLDGKWPLAFTIWNYDYDDNRTNKIDLLDLTSLRKQDLNINWSHNKEDVLMNVLYKICKSKKYINFNNTKDLLRTAYDLKLYDFIRTPTKSEKESTEIIGGLPLSDPRRQKNAKTYGIPNSDAIGFLGDCTPVRIRKRGDLLRFTDHNMNSIWFRLDTAFKDINKSKCFSGAADNRSYCANDLQSAKDTCTWFCITRILVGEYPLWANQFDIWKPDISEKYAQYWYSLCFSFVLAENRCVVTKYEKDNPVFGAPGIFINNPLSPILENNFWNNVLNIELLNQQNAATNLTEAVKHLYNFWNANYTKGKSIPAYELKDEKYFKYFNYEPFLTPHSGLIQIKKYADKTFDNKLLDEFKIITAHTKVVKQELYRLLVNEFKYFE